MKAKRHSDKTHAMGCCSSLVWGCLSDARWHDVRPVCL